MTDSERNVRLRCLLSGLYERVVWQAGNEADVTAGQAAVVLAQRRQVGRNMAVCFEEVVEADDGSGEAEPEQAADADPGAEGGGPSPEGAGEGDTEPEGDGDEDAQDDEDGGDDSGGWPLKIGPAQYLKMHPEGKHAELARQLVEADGGDE